MANGNNNNNNNNNNNRSAPTTTTISGVTPQSTTAALAGTVPKEPNVHQATISSAAPCSSTAQLAGQVPFEKPPGTYPESPIKDEGYNVNPLPATGTLGNPVKLAPGEKVPDSAKNVSSSGIGSNVTLDKGSYERGASDPAMAAMAAAAAATGASDKNKKQGDCGKDSQQKVSGKGDQQRFSGRDEQQKYSGRDEQQRSSGRDEQQRSSGRDEQQKYSGRDEQQRSSGRDEQQKFSGKDEQQKYSVSPMPATGTIGNPTMVSSGEKQSCSAKNGTPKGQSSNVTTDKQSSDRGASDPAMAAAAAATGGNGKKKQGENGNGQQQFSVNPLPATGTVGNPVKVAAGEKLPEQSTISCNTIGSNVTTDKKGYDKDASDPAMAAMAAAAAGGNNKKTGGNNKKQTNTNDDQQPYSVSPLPATGTVGNPVKTSPGEQLPKSGDVTCNTIGSKVTTDKESYDKGASDPAMAAMAAKQHDKKNTFSALPVDEPKSKSVGPNENPSISSAAPQATTAGLAGGVPLEKPAGSSKTAPAVGGQQYDPEVPAKEVPERVKESMNKAHVDPEAACLPEMVQEKKDLEKELLKEVSPATGSGQPAPTTSAAATSTAPAPTSTTTTTTSSTAPAAPAPATTTTSTTEPTSKQDSLQPGTGTDTGDVSPKSHTPEVPAGGAVCESSGNDGPVTKGTTASQVPEAPKETPEATTGPVTTEVPATSGAPEQKAQEQKPIEPRTTATVTAGADADTSAQEDAEAAADDMDRKKKNRISGFLYRLKEKFV